MKKSLVLLFILLSLGLVGCQVNMADLAAIQDLAETAPMDESAAAVDNGPVVVTGTVSSDNFTFTIPSLWPDPTIALIDMSNLNYLEAAVSQAFQEEQLIIILNPDSGVLGLLFEAAE